MDVKPRSNKLKRVEAKRKLQEERKPRAGFGETGPGRRHVQGPSGPSAKAAVGIAPPRVESPAPQDRRIAGG